MTTQTRTTYGEMMVNGVPARGRFDIERDGDTIWSQGPRPDPQWEMVDPAGHFHAYSTDGTLPTLQEEWEHVDCDGACGDEDCEGTRRTKYMCLICRAEIVPGTIPGAYSFTIEKPWSWSAVASGTLTVKVGDTVSLVITSRGTTWFGLATVTGTRLSSEEPLRIEFVGAGPLGEMDLEAK